MTAAPPGQQARRLRAAAVALLVAASALLAILLFGAPREHGHAELLPAHPVTARTTLQLPSAPAAQPVSPPASWRGTALPYARPVSLSIPAIGIENAPLRRMRPGPAPRLADAAGVGWLGRGPAPGEPGAAVLIGDVALFRLGEVRVGDRITVRRADRGDAVFSVYRVDRFASLRSAAVPGAAGRPELRLLRCGAAPQDKLLVYARLG